MQADKSAGESIKMNIRVAEAEIAVLFSRCSPNFRFPSESCCLRPDCRALYRKCNH